MAPLTGRILYARICWRCCKYPVKPLSRRHECARCSGYRVSRRNTGDE